MHIFLLALLLALPQFSLGLDCSDLPKETWQEAIGFDDSGTLPPAQVELLGGVDVIGGGGDPNAIEFLDIMKDVPDLIWRRPKVFAGITPEQFEKAYFFIKKSFCNRVTGDDKIGFTNKPQMYGNVPKPAWYDSLRRKVFVHKDFWVNKATKFDKLAIVILEGQLVAGVSTGRYERILKLLSTVESVKSFAKNFSERRVQTTVTECRIELKETRNGKSLPPQEFYEIDISTVWQHPSNPELFFHFQSIPINTGKSEKDFISFAPSLVLTSVEKKDKIRPRYLGHFFELRENGLFASTRKQNRNGKWHKLSDQISKGQFSSSSKDSGLEKAYRFVENYEGRFRNTTLHFKKEADVDPKNNFRKNVTYCSTLVVSPYWQQLILSPEEFKKLDEFTASFSLVDRLQNFVSECGMGCADVSETLDEDIANLKVKFSKLLPQKFSANTLHFQSKTEFIQRLQDFSKLYDSKFHRREVEELTQKMQKTSFGEQ